MTNLGLYFINAYDQQFVAFFLCRKVISKKID